MAIKLIILSIQKDKDAKLLYNKQKKATTEKSVYAKCLSLAKLLCCFRFVTANKCNSEGFLYMEHVQHTLADTSASGSLSDI